MRVAPIVLAALLVGVAACAGKVEPVVDASTDGGSDSSDGAISCATQKASCPYYGYGTTCSIPCALPSSCTFGLSLTWTGYYCCGSIEGSMDGCRCVGGFVVCPDGRGTLSAPKTYCEFCGPDGGY